MKYIKCVLALIIPILILTGCDLSEPTTKDLNKAINNTIIKKSKSYRLKANVKNKEDYINYIVLNKNNKEYTISIIDDNKTYSYKRKDNKNTYSKDFPSKLKKDYDYSNTDIFIDTLNNVEDLKDSKEKVNDEEYQKYEFSINKKYLNKILKGFNIETNKDGTGYAYVNKEKYIYMIIYTNDDITINVSYSRYNE